MARKPKHEEHENHERWLVSYADFITLLFAFFVVMYSISSVNEGKYRVLSDSIVAAFRAPPKSVLPIQVGEPHKAPMSPNMPLQQPSFMNLMQKPIIIDQAERLRQWRQQSEDAELKTLEQVKSEIKEISETIEKAMQPLIDKEMVTVRRNALWLEVEINNSLLFESGSASPGAEAVPVIEELAVILREFPYRIHVEGFTDNVPISTLAYPSNWELSSARAASVVHLLMKSGIDPTRMAAIGYGEYRPIADNDTAEGRNRNRRVVLVVSADSDKRVQDGDALGDLTEHGVEPATQPSATDPTARRAFDPEATPVDALDAFDTRQPFSRQTTDTAPVPQDRVEERMTGPEPAR
jgi:chemotaxis protein MotB